MTDNSQQKAVVGGGFKAMQYVLRCANRIGPRALATTVKSKNTCKACAFGTGGQRGGLHNEYSNRVEICNKNIQAHLGDTRAPIPPEIFAQNTIAELRELSGKHLEDLGRLAHPLYKAAGADQYHAIAYDKAIELVAQRLHAANPQRSFFYASGRSSNEAAFILQLFARVYGSNHVNNCSYYCHQASGVGLTESIGSGTATIQYGDLHKADLIFVLGANPASNHPRFVKVLLECRQRGGKVIVINPAREAGLVKFASPSNFRSMISGGGEVASQYIQPHIGGDVALLSAIAKKILEQGGVEKSFVEQHCLNFEDYEKQLNELTWSDLIEKAGVSQSEINEAASSYQSSKKTVFAWGMGLTHHQHGTDNIQAVANLALMRGMIGEPGCGLLPLRGHSNVQGVGSMGFTPTLKRQLFDAIEKEYQLNLPTYSGFDTMACMQQAHQGNIDAAFLLGGNLYAANPNNAFAAKALSNIPFKVMVSSSLNQTHVHGVDGENLILPILVRDEEQQATTQESMFSYVRMSDGGIDRIPTLRSEVDLVSSIAATTIRLISEANKDCHERIGLLDFTQFKEHENIRKAIANVVPGFEQLADIDNSKEEFHIGGRHFKKNRFPTASGKAKFISLNPAIHFTRTLEHPKRQDRKANNKDQFVLSSVRSEGQFNTIVYSEEDTYRRQSHRHVLFINPTDMLRLGIEEGDLLDVENETGTLNALHATAYPIRAGNVMTYFPEANALVPTAVDKRSKTPAFKSVAVHISRSR